MAFAITDGERRYFIILTEDEERFILGQAAGDTGHILARAGGPGDAELLVEGLPADLSLTGVYNLFRSAGGLAEVRLARRSAFLKFLSAAAADEAAARFGDLQVNGSKLELSRSTSYKTVFIEDIDERLFNELILQDLSSRTGLRPEITIRRSAHERRKSCSAVFRDQTTAHLVYERLFAGGAPAVCGYGVSVEPVPAPPQVALSRACFSHYELSRSRDALRCTRRPEPGRQEGEAASGARLVASPVPAGATVVDLLAHFAAVPGLAELQLRQQQQGGGGGLRFALLHYESPLATQAAFHRFHEATFRGQKMAVLPEVISPLCDKKTMVTSLHTQDVCVTDGAGLAQRFHVYQCNGQHIGRLAGADTDRHAELYVASLDSRVTLLDLLRLFARVPGLSEVRLMIGFSGYNRGFGFVRYGAPHAAAEAMRVFQKAQVFGKRLAVQKSTNSKSLLFRRIPPTMNDSYFQSVLREVTPGVSSVVFFGPAGPPAKKCCLVNYADHQSATTARRKLIPHCDHIFGCKMDIDWAPVSECSGKEDKCSYLEEQMVESVQQNFPKL